MDEKSALLEKIRRDMADTRARIKQMQARQSVILDVNLGNELSELPKLKEEVFDIEVDDDGSPVDPSASPAAESGPRTSALSAPVSTSVTSTAGIHSMTPSSSNGASSPKVEHKTAVSVLIAQPSSPASQRSASSSSMSKIQAGGDLVERLKAARNISKRSMSPVLDPPRQGVSTLSPPSATASSATASSVTLTAASSLTPLPEIIAVATPSNLSVRAPATASASPAPAVPVSSEQGVSADGPQKKIVRLRRGTLVEGAEHLADITGPVEITTNAEGKKVIRIRKVSVDQADPLTKKAFESATKVPDRANRKSRAPSVAAPKKIRNLQDLQAAIQKADSVKQQAKVYGEEGERKREETKRVLTQEERRAIRASKRLTMELNNSESRVKIDTQISQFVLMMQKLEEEWQKGEEARVEKEKELIDVRSALEKTMDQMNFISRTAIDAQTQIEHLKIILERVIDQAPPRTKKDDKWQDDLKQFHDGYLSMRHNILVNVAKHNKSMKTSVDFLTVLPPPSGAPVSVSPRTSGSPSVSPMAPKINPVSNLLHQIRSGTQLKRLDPEQVKQERESRTREWRQSVQLLRGLQETLREALDQRHLSMLEDDEDEEEDDWDEDEDDATE